jgi:NADH:ubiquinone oxidoreductase subunit E
MYGATALPEPTHGRATLLQGPDRTIAVETSATLIEGLELLQQFSGERYLAVTNKETLGDALRLTAETVVGVMNSQGEIVRPAAKETGGTNGA